MNDKERKSRDIVSSMMYYGTIDRDDFDYNNITGPRLSQIFTYNDLYAIEKVASDIDLKKNKYQKITNILNYFGFVKLGVGTNRMVFSSPYYPTIVLKVALDGVAMSDNKSEQFTQKYVSPFCTKCFDVSRSGILGVFEKVEPFIHVEEFEQFEDIIFDKLRLFSKFFVFADISKKCFMNFGYRPNFGPVILDFPYFYFRDFTKRCKNTIHGRVCDGEIKFTPDFTELRCTKCNCIKSAKELRLDSFYKSELNMGKTNSGMIIKIMTGDKVEKVIDHSNKTKILERDIVRRRHDKLKEINPYPIIYTIGGETSSKD